jgi:hypothetical protein
MRPRNHLPTFSIYRLSDANLSVRANEGMLTEGEEAELEAYINVGDLLAFW